MVTIHLVFWSLSLFKEIHCTTAYIYTHRKIIKAPLLHQGLGPCVCLSFFLPLSLPPSGSLSLSYRRLRTTRFQSIKGPQHSTPALCLNISSLHLQLYSSPANRFICTIFFLFPVAVVQSPSSVQHFITPLTAAYQASLSLTISQNLPKFMSWWYHPTSSSSVTLLSFCLQPFPASGSFPVSQLLPSGGQSIGASASASVFLTNVQGWFTLGLSGLISLMSKGVSRVFSSTTVQKHQFFHVQPSIQSNSHIRTWLLEKQ